eukprot:scaffold100756_cov32-Prasinocladus_malaysianus.AAC.1
MSYCCLVPVREQAKAAKQEEKDREKAEKAKKKEEEKAERERKRLEALEAKRYPIDDTQLLEEQLAKGAVINGALSAFNRLLVSSASPFYSNLCVLNTTATLQSLSCPSLDPRRTAHRWLGCCRPGGYASKYCPGCQCLSKKAGSNRKAKTDEPEGFELISQLYEGLLATIMGDLVSSGLASRLERRWNSLLDSGTWPEILRRYILLSHQ